MATILIKSDTQQWFLEKDEIQKIKVLKELVDLCNDTKLHVLDVYDDEHNVFDLIVKLLRMPIKDACIHMCNLSFEIQVKLYTLCDYLDIHVLQTRIARIIADRLNTSNMAQLRYAISILT
jgi:hypothetical protein